MSGSWSVKVRNVKYQCANEALLCGKFPWQFPEHPYMCDGVKSATHVDAEAGEVGGE